MAAQFLVAVEFEETFAWAGSATHSDEELTIELLTTHGVSVHPGRFYDFRAEGFLVVSLITPEQAFAEGTSRLLATF